MEQMSLETLFGCIQFNAVLPIKLAFNEGRLVNNIDKEFKGYTLLTYAIKWRRSEIVNVLLQIGADPHRGVAEVTPGLVALATKQSHLGLPLPKSLEHYPHVRHYLNTTVLASDEPVDPIFLHSFSLSQRFPTIDNNQLAMTLYCLDDPLTGIIPILTLVSNYLWPLYP